MSQSKNHAQNIYETITAKLLAAIEANPGDPVMPWQRGGTRPVLPTNAVTGHAYRGVNILSLWVTALERGYGSGEWATLRQWNEKGAHVRKGEKASPIVFYKEITVGDEARAGRRRRRDRAPPPGARLLGVRRRAGGGLSAGNGAAAQPDRPHRRRGGLLRRDGRQARHRWYAGLLPAFDRYHPHAGRGALFRRRRAQRGPRPGMRSSGTSRRIGRRPASAQPRSSANASAMPPTASRKPAPRSAPPSSVRALALPSSRTPTTPATSTIGSRS